MSKLSSNILGAPQDLFLSNANQQADAGATMTTGDGRYFRYMYSGAVALVAGTLLQGPSRISNHLQVSPTASTAATVTSAGANQLTGVGAYPTITVTLGSTAATANFYAFGTLNVTLDAGTNGLPGFQYQILSHPAAGSGATLTLTLSDPIQNVITTSAKIDLIPNPAYGTIIYPTTGLGVMTGVAVVATPLNNWGWMQVAGNSSILNDAGGTITVGNTVVPSTSVAGAIKSATGTLPVVGVAASAITASQNGTVFVNGIL